MIDVVLLDVEGTTTPITFVKESLFPLARARLRAFVAAHEGDPEVRAALDASRAILGGSGASVDDVLGALERWIDEDRKAPPLKALQGLIWREAYADGSLRAPVYADVAPAFVRLRGEGARLFVYSSGSVLAQKLLFAHTNAGDLTPQLDGYFDATIGAKTERASYLAIARAIGVEPARIAFFSDARGELEAACSAGLAAIEVVRDGEPSGWFAHVRTFAELTREDLEPIARSRALGTLERARCESLLALARDCHARGWVTATSGNFSVRLDPTRIAITASGRDKGHLALADLGVIDARGVARAPAFRPSAETPLHCALYRRDARVGAVAHTHSVAATVLSRRHAAASELRVSGFEMQKALPGVTGHEASVALPIFRATQDMDRLAIDLASTLADDASAYLLEGHGLTAWGDDVDSARRHLEAWEFLLACALAER